MRKFILVSLIGIVTHLTGCAPLVVGGAGVGVMMAEDRRTPSTYVMDEEIELTAALRLRQAQYGDVHANFTSFNRWLLVTGEAPTEALKGKTDEIARGVANVREVYNELAVAAPSSLIDRSNDSYITAKVKTRLIEDRRLNAMHVKVVTERGIVYLMGLARHTEADIAADIAARTSGVQKVIKVFEYID